ncbi:TlpA family protein disulfide reductase [Candidatus Marinimicrobia bacterium MT.SAG.2]|nr:TlpA family protein disulfide reductase [Candidatus Marinimicrobia bacterium MT.SAG.2]
MDDLREVSQSRQRESNKTIYMVMSLILIFTSFWIYSSPNGVSILSENREKLAIDFVAHDLSGKKFEGSTLLGKTVLLDFWAVWCAPCIAAFPELNRLEAELKKSNFEIVGIALYSGNSDDIKETLDKHVINYRILIGDNDELSQRYGVIGFPTYFLITPEGTVFKKYVGELPGLFDRIKKDVEKINKKYDQAGSDQGVVNGI